MNTQNQHTVGGRQFCSRLSIANEEPIAGTAQHYEKIVFVGYPKQLWASNHLKSRGFPVEVANYLGGLKGDPRRVAVRFFDFRDGVDGETSLIICPQMKRMDNVAISDLPTVLEQIFNNNSANYENRSLSGRHLFLCTHGVRDMCCAKFGFGAVRALKHVLSGEKSLQHEYAVWETTHLVGDRFAGTGIAFPEGRMYGRLCGESAASWLETIDSGKIDLPKYRGSIFLPQRHQIVEAALQEHFVDSAADITITDTSDIHRLIYEIRLQNGVVKCGDALIESVAFKFFSSCSHIVDDSVSRKERWIVKELTTQ